MFFSHEFSLAHHSWRGQTTGFQVGPELQQEQCKVTDSLIVPRYATSTAHLHTSITLHLQELFGFTRKLFAATTSCVVGRC